MVFEPNFAKVSSSDRKNIGIMQSVVEVVLPIQDGVIDEVYSVGAKACVLNFDVVNRVIDFAGLVDLQVMYKGDVGVSAIDYSAEFKDKYMASEDVAGELVLNTNVVDVNSQISGNGVKIIAIIEVSIDEIITKDVNVLVRVKGDGVYQNTKELEYATYIGRAYEKFDVSHEVSISGAKNVLMVTPCVSLTNVTPKDNYLILNGVLGLDVCYQTGENINDIASNYYNVDFSWEVALSGMNEDSFVESMICLLSNEIKVTTTPEENSSNVSIYVPVVYSGYVFNNNKIEVVDDVYLEDYYLSVTTENAESIVSSGVIDFTDNISGTASIMETAPCIDEVLGVSTNNIVLARSVVEDNKLIVEGIANASVLYFTKETNELTSVVVEMPFVVEHKAEWGIPSISSICLSGISARSKRGKEIEVSAKLNIYGDLYSVNTISLISDIALGEEKPEDDCSLFIYIVKPGQTLWDIAKELGVSIDLILEQNEGLELPLKTGEKVVIYKPKVVKF